MTPVQVQPPHAINPPKRKAKACVENHVQCPDCGSREVRRLHRNWAQRIITKVANAYPHVCMDCMTRFYSLSGK